MLRHFDWSRGFTLKYQNIALTNDGLTRDRLYFRTKSLRGIKKRKIKNAEKLVSKKKLQKCQTYQCTLFHEHYKYFFKNVIFNNLLNVK